MQKPIDPKVKKLIERIPSLIKNFSYRNGPDMYFYQKTMKFRRQMSVNEFLDDASDKHMDLMYATLVSWDMNSRGAKMKYFDDFKLAILKNKKSFQYLASYSLDQISEAKFLESKNIGFIIFQTPWFEITFYTDYENILP